ncbi:ArnT family glycosyltransferase [Iningainema tapete]|uniref:Glycosyltransferase family 39 protein n=1 Tax=Iningainema tapete BLCC-T55 TaxID=2748662 RepID=A0A8J6XUY3_9CYAN|nr:glycosyltransferase family 39 protein [Iningainema tapete]MBD2776557.1 glycosyltransferase family 39 protein [Iningainema tapete BLCC-T55]
MTNRAFDKWFDNIPKRPTLFVTVSILWLIFIGWLGYGWHLGSIGLIDETEPLFAEASRQMFKTGDWITPFFNNETRFDKPALIYWCQAIAYSILGVNEWAVRLPSALAAVGLISLAFYAVQWHLARDVENSQPQQRWLTASIAAAMMGLNAEMIVWGRVGVSDMLLTGCIASALLCFFLGYATEGQGNSQLAIPNKWYLAFYVLVAGAILTKGPVGIVLPGLIVGTFLLYLSKVKEVLREMRPLLGILIISGLSMPWYLLVTWRNGWNFINSFFGYHNLERFTNVVNRHSAPWYFYFLVVLIGFAPYSVYLPLAIARIKFWQPKFWQSQERSRQLGLFAFVWFAVVFCFFTVAVTKLPSYVLPLMPAAAILVALLWNDTLTNSQTHKLPLSPLLWSGWFNVAFLSTLAVAMYSLPKLIGNDPAAPNFRSSLQQSGLLMVGGAIWLFCAVVVAALLVRRRWHNLILVNLLAFAAFLVFVLTPALFIMDNERQLPLRELSAIAIQVQLPNEELVMVGFKKPSVVFYTQRPVNFIRLTQDAAKYIKDESTQKLPPRSLLILTQPKKLVEMGLKSTDYNNLATRGAYQLIRIPLNNIAKNFNLVQTPHRGVSTSSTSD